MTVHLTRGDTVDLRTGRLERAPIVVRTVAGRAYLPFSQRRRATITCTACGTPVNLTRSPEHETPCAVCRSTEHPTCQHAGGAR